MTAATDTYLLLRAFVDELARCGMRAACTSPGSRCAPLVLSLAREPRLRCYSHIDERCAGFFALGLAKATGLPVAVACTSGTAAAELLPAAIEAHEARVPLLLLTADRPPELREIGAGQAIDQLKLFGGAAKWFFEVGTHDATPRARCAGCARSPAAPTATALEGRPGAVHLNFPLREPLVADEPLPDDDSGRPDGAPYVRARPRTPAAARRTRRRGARRAASRGARRGVVVAGRDERADRRARGAAAAAFAAARRLAAAGRPAVRRAPRRGGDRALRRAAARRARSPRALQPDLVLRVGDLPSSKPLRSWLAGLDGVPQVALDPEGAWQDPDAVLSRLARARARARRSTRSPTARRAARRRRLAGAAGAAPTSARPRRSAACSATAACPSRAVAAELGVLLPAAGDAVRRLLDAGARHRDVLAGARRPAARALQPRRQRHRRHRLERLRRGRRAATARSCC